MTNKERIWGTRCGHASEIVERVVQYLKEHPANYQGQVDTLLELLYQTFTEYNSAETPEFRKQVDPLDDEYSVASEPLNPLQRAIHSKL